MSVTDAQAHNAAVSIDTGKSFTVQANMTQAEKIILNLEPI